MGGLLRVRDLSTPSLFLHGPLRPWVCHLACYNDLERGREVTISVLASSGWFPHPIWVFRAPGLRLPVRGCPWRPCPRPISKPFKNRSEAGARASRGGGLAHLGGGEEGLHISGGGVGLRTPAEWGTKDTQ